MDTPITNSEGSGRRPRLLVLLIALLVGGVVAALGVGVAVGGDDTAAFDGDPPPWAFVLGATLSLIGLAVEIGALVWTVRSGRYRAARRSRLLTLSWSHRLRLGRQVRHGTPEAGDDAVLLEEMARQMAGNRWSAGLMAGLMTVSVGQALMRFAPFWAVFSGVVAVAGAVAIVLVIRDARRAEAFLRAHPDLTGQ
ncbi:hypothetical protein ACLQ26_12535 [Micromonospora sp. DT43]|uniref:hypothetical protein n=1 Tax=Micromonospora sp. DT43 TaxID=3393440 RepID=UPI003CF830C3